MGIQLPTNGRLDGWKAIADYLGWHTRTVMRWEAQKGLPIHRVPGGQRNAVYAYKNEIDDWLKLGESQTLITQVEEVPIANPAGSSEEVFQYTFIDRLETEHSHAVANALRPGSFWRGRSGKRLTLAIAVALVVVVCAVTLHSLATDRHIKITSVSQITDDGASKTHLVTDGTFLYFGEYRDGKIGVFMVPIVGGSSREIPTRFTRTFPTGVSQDGKELLVLAGDGYERERQLWILQVPDGGLKRVGSVTCHDAAWSPDGRAIAFASQNSIFITPDEGKTLKPVQTFEGVPESIRWSTDGSRLRAQIRDADAMTYSYWDLNFEKAGSYRIDSLTPVKTDLQSFFSRSMAVDQIGRSFLVGGDDPSHYGFLILAKGGSVWRSHYAIQNLNVPLEGDSEIALDWRHHRFFAFGSSAAAHAIRKEHADVFWFDQGSSDFQPFLPGAGAEYIDFTRDGKWVTYVSSIDGSLYLSRADGSGARRLTYTPGMIQLPRWSPDGSQIAFMQQLPNRPWRDFVLSTTGGAPREAGHGGDSQGAPTWSADGKMLAYGSVECQEIRSCAIHMIDLSSGLESIVLGSEGLGTARWSPDGKFIAALDSVNHRVMLFTLSTRKWREVASGITGNDLSWSSDSRYLFASRPAGDPPEIIRIDPFGGKVTTALDLSKLARLQGSLDSWFAIGPRNSIILSREMARTEIYSISYED